MRQHKVAPSVFTSADHRGSFIHSRPRYYRGRLHCAHCVHDAQQLQNDFDCKFKKGFHFFPFLCINNHQKYETRHSLRQLVDAQNQFQCSVHCYEGSAALKDGHSAPLHVTAAAATTTAASAAEAAAAASERIDTHQMCGPQSVFLHLTQSATPVRYRAI